MMQPIYQCRACNRQQLSVRRAWRIKCCYCGGTFPTGDDGYGCEAEWPGTPIQDVEDRDRILQDLREERGELSYEVFAEYWDGRTAVYYYGNYKGAARCAHKLKLDSLLRLDIRVVTKRVIEALLGQASEEES